MSSVIQHFLLVFDHLQGKLQGVERFGSDAKKAVARYEELEKQFRHEQSMDIVLVGSDSLETVRVTHANYFEQETSSMVGIEQYLRKVSDLHGKVASK